MSLARHLQCKLHSIGYGYICQWKWQGSLVLFQVLPPITSPSKPMTTAATFRLRPTSPAQQQLSPRNSRLLSTQSSWWSLFLSLPCFLSSSLSSLYVFIAAELETRIWSARDAKWCMQASDCLNLCVGSLEPCLPVCSVIGGLFWELCTLTYDWLILLNELCILHSDCLNEPCILHSDWLNLTFWVSSRVFSLLVPNMSARHPRTLCAIRILSMLIGGPFCDTCTLSCDWLISI